MAIINFDPTADLQAQKAALLAQIAELDAREPKNMNSEAHEDWEDEHEDLEDQEIRELLQDVSYNIMKIATLKDIAR